jgi:ParB/RepB/Spo0J family partition protein
MAVAKAAATNRQSTEEASSVTGAQGAKVVDSGTLVRVPISAIGPHPDQPRSTINEEKLKELAASIVRVGGLLNPVDVRPAVAAEAREGEPAYEYRLIAGQRRLEAYRRLHALAPTPEGKERWATIPAIVKQGLDEAAALEQAVIENIQREELSPLDEAEAYARIKRKRGLKSAKDVAALVGKKEERVRRLLRLNESPDVVKKALRTGLTVPVPVPSEDGVTQATERLVRERCLDYLEALEFTDLHEHLFHKYGGFKNSAATRKAEEGTRRLMERALTDGWGFRKIQEYIAAIKDCATAPLDTPPKPPLRLFHDDGRRLTVDRKAFSGSRKEDLDSLRSALAKLTRDLEALVSNVADS